MSKHPNDGITSSIPLTRAQRRQMQKLADKVDRLTEADRLFFERRPDRQHRVRLAGLAEIEQQALLEGEPLKLKPGFKLYAVVRNVVPGARLGLLLPAPEGRETDLSEAMARVIFEVVATPQTWEVEADMRRMMEDRA
jgi:hypothetical protein